MKQEEFVELGGGIDVLNAVIANDDIINDFKQNPTKDLEKMILANPYIPAKIDDVPELRREDRGLIPELEDLENSARYKYFMSKLSRSQKVVLSLLFKTSERRGEVHLKNYYGVRVRQLDSTYKEDIKLRITFSIAAGQECRAVETMQTFTEKLNRLRLNARLNRFR